MNGAGKGSRGVIRVRKASKEGQNPGFWIIHPQTLFPDGSELAPPPRSHGGGGGGQSLVLSSAVSLIVTRENPEKSPVIVPHQRVRHGL